MTMTHREETKDAEESESEGVKTSSVEEELGQATGAVMEVLVLLVQITAGDSTEREVWVGMQAWSEIDQRRG